MNKCSRVTGVKLLLLPVAFLLLARALSGIPWLAPDWMNFYRPAALSARPNDVLGNHAPPWTYLALYPLAVLPDGFSKGALTLTTLAICRLYVGNWRRFAVLCLTMPLLATIAFGQVDALVLVGLMLPADLSLLFLSMKPQAAVLTAFKGRLTAWSICLLLIMIVVSFLLWGNWLAVVWQKGIPFPNPSTWPWGIPFGLGLLFWQWKKGFDSDAVLCIATLLLVPYFFFASLLPATAAAIKELDDDWASMAVVVVLTWLFVFATGVGL